MTSVHDVRSPADTLKATSGRKRAVIEGVRPELDCGRFPIKRVIGESVVVEADIFADGHDHIACRLLYRRGQDEFASASMQPLGNDRWRAEFSVAAIGRYSYTIEAWVDRLETWRADLLKRIAAEQNVDTDLLIGSSLIQQAARRAAGEDADRLWAWAATVREDHGAAAALREDLLDIARRYPDPESIARYGKELQVVVDREKARFSAWYELFPRSCSNQPGRHGTLRDCEAWLPYVASMGFDVLYLPPIHPIGGSFRKGRNNAETAQPGDAGSPWAIGSAAGGHKSIHPELGTLDDFRRLLRRAGEFGIEIAIDIAFQASADHPYLTAHPEWFRRRPDGSIQYAENPPKKYQDIYPFDFESPAWPSLWRELLGVFEFWIGEGVKIFRVDNPHTKPFAFWEWAIEEIKAVHPDVILLSEAFTRPRVMYRLAKLGFTQSYTYFTWRNTKQEIVDYFRELTSLSDFFRPSLWPNTPDILNAFLQHAGPASFEIRLILAATLGSSYGIYGPAFELCENIPREPGSEEYSYSEKYELKQWPRDSPASLRSLIAKVNRIRRENPALHSSRSLRFHDTDNPNLICYSKTSADAENAIAVVVNLDPVNRQWGFVNLDLEPLRIDSARPFQAIDLLGGGSYVWHGSRNYVELTPGILPAHVLLLRNGA